MLLRVEHPMRDALSAEPFASLRFDPNGIGQCPNVPRVIDVMGCDLPAARGRNVYSGHHKPRTAIQTAAGQLIPNQRAWAIETAGDDRESRASFNGRVVTLPKKRKLAAAVRVPIRINDGPELWTPVPKFPAPCTRREGRGRHEEGIRWFCNSTVLSSGSDRGSRPCRTTGKQEGKDCEQEGEKQDANIH